MPAGPELAPEASAQPEGDPVSEPRPAACALLGLGLDLRALGTQSSPEAVDRFVLGQADDLRARTSGAPPRIQHVPGAGVLYALFDGESDAAARARCEQARERYLADAPRLPVLMEPVASVSVPCEPCERAER